MPLREVREPDLAVFYEHQREPEANRMAAFAARPRDAFMTHWRQNVLGNPAIKKKTVVTGETIAGNVVSWPREDKRLLGYWIGQAYWGQGIATAAVSEFVREHETSRPLYAYVAVTNIASIRVLEKCGFRRSGAGGTAADGVEEVLMCLSAPAT